MKHIFLLAVIFTAACNQKAKQSNSSTPTTANDTIVVVNDPKKYLNIQTGSFSEIDSSGVLIFPLEMGQGSRKGRGEYYKDIPYNSYWNLLFYNSRLGEYYLLSDSLKMLVRDFSNNSSRDASVISQKGFLFFRITTEDKDQDKLLTTDDPEYLYVTNREGKGLKQISPNHCKLISWERISNSSLIVMTVTKDTNKNNEFDDEDEESAYRYDLLADSMPREIFSDSTKTKLKTLYDRDWKKQKQPD